MKIFLHYTLLSIAFLSSGKLLSADHRTFVSDSDKDGHNATVYDPVKKSWVSKDRGQLTADEMQQIKDNTEMSELFMKVWNDPKKAAERMASGVTWEDQLNHRDLARYNELHAKRDALRRSVMGN